MATIELAKIEYGRDVQTSQSTVVVTFAVDTGDAPPLPATQDYLIKVVNLATGDLGSDVQEAKASVHQVLRDLVAETADWA